MATLSEYHDLTTRERINRYFSEEFKKKIVSELDRGLLTSSELIKEYKVCYSTISRWRKKYSKLKPIGIKQVVEMESSTKKLQQLREEIKELHRILGTKQLRIDFQDKMIELAEEEYGIDIKKKFGGKLFSGTGITGKATDTK